MNQNGDETDYIIGDFNFRPMRGWTKQKIKDHITTNFKGKSIKEGDSITCAYRGCGGAKCAVGLFIPDEIYDEEMDHNSNELYSSTGVLSLVSKFPQVLPHMPLPVEALKRLQGIHDHASEDTCLAEMIKWIDDHVVEY